MENAQKVISELMANPINVGLLGLIVFLVYKIVRGRRPPVGLAPDPPLAKLKKQDFTLEQLREFDGTGAEGRVLLAVNGRVFDVTRGKNFYGPNGPYSVFAGRDASRGLAMFSVSEDVIREEYDDLQDLDSEQMERVREWEQQLSEKYDHVGKLLRPGEQATDYEVEEETTAAPDSTKSD
ncbi:membrane-associated progesterone receptor component 1-like [Watersipora subatra]|uniref:membrane-associated progesterone receptor component 1-like n=1 Tax=Watersipora subatra TaxID=2589382 RepID=UPI00355B05EB